MPAKPATSGFINIAKPEGMTSRDVVNRLQQITGIKKLGHAGTLDPMASGVLVVGVGRATRLIQFVQRFHKTYDAEFVFGRTSDTDDIWGAIVEDSPTRRTCSREQLDQAIAQLVGEVEQVPPSVSAVKVGGKRAYKWAREGAPVALSPRKVTVHRISVVDYSYPKLAVQVICGSGTYIRSIARDLGKTLQVGAVMSRLCRRAIGPFTLDSAVSLGPLQRSCVTEALIPAEKAFLGTMAVDLSEAQLRALSVGKPVCLSDVGQLTTEVMALDVQRRFAAWLVRTDDNNASEFRAVVNWVPGRTPSNAES